MKASDANKKAGKAKFKLVMEYIAAAVERGEPECCMNVKIVDAFARKELLRLGYSLDAGTAWDGHREVDVVHIEWRDE